MPPTAEYPAEGENEERALYLGSCNSRYRLELIGNRLKFFLYPDYERSPMPIDSSEVPHEVLAEAAHSEKLKNLEDTLDPNDEILRMIRECRTH